MKRLSDLPPRDLELLSAYLDEGLRPKDKERLVARLEREPDLLWALEELRRTVSIVRGLPELRPPRSFTLTPESAGIRARVPAYPLLQLATALATLAFVAVVGLDALTSRAIGVSLAPAAQEQAERLAAASIEESTVSAPSEALPALGITGAEEPPQALSELAVGSPTPQPTVSVGEYGPPVTLPGASEALPTSQPEEAVEDRAFTPSGTQCIGCGGGEGELDASQPPSIAMAPPASTSTPTAAPTEAPAGKIGEAPLAADQGNAPLNYAQPPGDYRSRVTLVRLAEVSLGLAAVIMAGLTLWVRRRG